MTIKDINALQIMRGKNLRVRMYITNKVNEVIKGSTLLKLRDNKVDALVCRVLNALGIEFDVWSGRKFSVFANGYIVCKKGYFDTKDIVKKYGLEKIKYKA